MAVKVDCTRARGPIGRSTEINQAVSHNRWINLCCCDDAFAIGLLVMRSAAGVRNRVDLN
jgi:hypothetical protein